MTMQEPIPSDSGEYTPAIDADHETIVEEFMQLMIQNGEIGTNLDSLINAQRLLDNDMFNMLMQIGYFYIPVNDDETLADDRELHDLHNLATVAALTCLDVLCDYLGFDKVEFRQVWLKQGLITLVDLKHDNIKDLSLKEKHQAVIQGIIEFGDRAMRKIPQEYNDALEVLSDDESVYLNSNLFKGAFGHVFGRGYKTLSMLGDVSRAHQFDFDSGAAEIFEEAMKQGLFTEGARFADIDHEAIARQIDTDMYYPIDDYEGFEAYVGKFTEHLLDVDDGVTNLCNDIACSLHSNDYDTGEYRLTAESFFYGQMLALTIVEHASPNIGATLSEILVHWKHQSGHVKLTQSEERDEETLNTITKHVTEKIDKYIAIPAYSELLDSICSEQRFEASEESAFRNGFMYALTTLTEAARVHEKKMNNRLVSAQMKNIDDELAQLLGDQ